MLARMLIILVGMMILVTCFACGSREVDIPEAEPQESLEIPVEDEVIEDEATIVISAELLFELQEVEFLKDFEPIDERHAMWAYDIAQLRNRVFTLHPKFNDERIMHLEQNIVIGMEFDESIKALIKNVPELTDFEIKSYLQRSIAILRDNHTNFFASEPSFLQESYPLNFGLFYDGFYLYQSSADFTDALNLRLVSINDIPLDIVFKEYSGFFSNENIYDAKSSFAAMLSVPNVLKAIGVTADNGTTYTFDDGSSSGLSITLTDTVAWSLEGDFAEPLEDKRAEGDLPLFLRRRLNAQGYIFLREFDTLYIRVHSFAYPCFDTIDRIQDFVTENSDDIHAVILDARGNLGGMPTHYSNLFTWITEFIPDVKIFYFMDEASRSASVLVGGHLIDLGATTVGQPAGQNTNMYASIGANDRIIRLKYSGLELFVSFDFFTAGIHDFDAIDMVLYPDVLIDYTIDDWINNHDPLLEYVIDLLR